MEIKTLVKTTAKIARITTLEPGNVYKRLVDDYGTQRIVFGVVTDVMNNGTEAAVTAVEVDTQYGGPTTALRAFGNATDVALFPATVEEVSEFFNKAETAAEDDVESKARALFKAEQLRDQVIRLRSLSLSPAQTVDAAELEA